MRFANSGRVAHLIFCTACLNLALLGTPVSAFDASTESRINRAAAMEADLDLSENMGQISSCRFVGNENCQSNDTISTTGLVFENINNVKNRDIHGSELMTKSELAKFRRDIKQCETPEQLEDFLERHRLRMEARAVERGVVLR